jgi:hypothetical protein
MIRLRSRYRIHESRQFVGVQLSVMIAISPSELHFPGTENA